MTCTLPLAAQVHLQSTQNTKRLLFHQLQEVVVTKSPLFSHMQLGRHQLHQTQAVLFWFVGLMKLEFIVTSVHRDHAPTATFLAHEKKGSAWRHDPVLNSWHKHTLTLLGWGKLMTSLPQPTELFTLELCLFVVILWTTIIQQKCILKRANLYLYACKTPTAVYQSSASEIQLVICIASKRTSFQDGCVLQQKQKKETNSVTTTATPTFSES